MMIITYLDIQFTQDKSQKEKNLDQAIRSVGLPADARHDARICPVCPSMIIPHPSCLRDCFFRASPRV
jgi:hypothetical protein